MTAGRAHGQRHSVPDKLGRGDLEIAKQLKPSLEHVEVVIVIVVFDIEHFGHDRSLFDQLLIRSPRRRGQASLAAR